jgi:hypothetical protein
MYFRAIDNQVLRPRTRRAKQKHRKYWDTQKQSTDFQLPKLFHGRSFFAAARAGRLNATRRHGSETGRISGAVSCGHPGARPPAAQATPDDKPLKSANVVLCRCQYRPI